MIFKDIDIKKLLQLMQEHDVSEITLKDGKIAIEVKRGREPVIRAAALDIPETEARPAVKMDVEEDEEDHTSQAAEDPSDNYHAVEAPLVGTFYRASSPDTDPFVDVGDRVDSGDVLCIVEAMKSMNEIQADVAGVVKEICAKDGDLVEYEQVLFKVESTG